MGTVLTDLAPLQHLATGQAQRAKGYSALDLLRER